MAKLINTEINGTLLTAGDASFEGNISLLKEKTFNFGNATISATNVTDTPALELPNLSGTLLVDGLLVAGNNITITKDETTGKLTIASTASGTGDGTSVKANPTTTTADPDISTIGISDTNYNINAKKLDGHDVDDLTAIINAAYVPDVTLDVMNSTIETKINEALASLEFNRYYTGTTVPASDFGNDGDLYLQQ